MENSMENISTVESEENKGDKEMLQMPDGTMADVTNMSPEERRDLVESYKDK